MSDTIQTLHPHGKQGVNISRAKYDLVRQTMIDILAGQGDKTASELSHAVVERLQPTFDGSVMWYCSTIKLDLEARGVIVAVPKSRPPRWRLAADASHQEEIA